MFSITFLQVTNNTVTAQRQIKMRESHPIQVAQKYISISKIESEKKYWPLFKKGK